MHFNTLDHLRQQIYRCFERSQDALFNLSDALVSESQARSLPELSLSVFFERRWPSVYEALQDGRINVERLREVFVQALLENKPTDEPIWLGIDSSSMQRLEAESSRDRGMIYMSNMPHATKPVSVGWQFSTLMLFPSSPVVGSASWNNGALAATKRRSKWASNNCARCCPRCDGVWSSCWRIAGTQPPALSTPVTNWAARH